MRATFAVRPAPSWKIIRHQVYDPFLRNAASVVPNCRSFSGRSHQSSGQPGEFDVVAPIRMAKRGACPLASICLCRGCSLWRRCVRLIPRERGRARSAVKLVTDVRFRVTASSVCCVHFDVESKSAGHLNVCLPFFVTASTTP
jgi:hypothetical protein